MLEAHLPAQNDGKGGTKSTTAHTAILVRPKRGEDYVKVKVGLSSRTGSQTIAMRRMPMRILEAIDKRPAVIDLWVDGLWCARSPPSRRMISKKVGSTKHRKAKCRRRDLSACASFDSSRNGDDLQAQSHRHDLKFRS